MDFKSKVFVFVMVYVFEFGDKMILINLLFMIFVNEFDVVFFLFDEIKVNVLVFEQIIVEFIESEVIFWFDEFVEVIKLFKVVGISVVIDYFGVGFVGLLFLLCF